MVDEKNEKAKIIVGLSSMFRVDLDEVTLMLYLSALEDLSLELLKKLVTIGIRQWTFMPRPCEILAIGAPSEAEKKLQAKSSFQKILDGARRGKFPSLEEAEKKALRSIGGFEAIRMAHNEELVWIEKRFVESFEGAQDESERFEIIDQLKQLTHSVKLKVLK